MKKDREMREIKGVDVSKYCSVIKEELRIQLREIMVNGSIVERIPFILLFPGV